MLVKVMVEVVIGDENRNGGGWSCWWGDMVVKRWWRGGEGGDYDGRLGGVGDGLKKKELKMVVEEVGEMEEKEEMVAGVGAWP